MDSNLNQYDYAIISSCKSLLARDSRLLYSQMKAILDDNKNPKSLGYMLSKEEKESAMDGAAIMFQLILNPEFAKELKEKMKKNEIKINGKDVDWQDDYITYEQLLISAYPKISKEAASEINMSATYDYPKTIDKRGKIFNRGDIVKVESGMIFNIVDTGNA